MRAVALSSSEPSKCGTPRRCSFRGHCCDGPRCPDPMAAGNILTLQRLLGHSSVAVTMKYAHLAPDFVREEVGRMSFTPRAAGVVELADHRKRPRSRERQTRERYW